MKKYLILLLAVFALNSCQYEDEIYELMQDRKTKKVDVCHYDADTDSWITLNISKKALPAHLRHGDKLGECEERKTYVPDDEFEKFLICKGLDDILDDYVLTENIEEIEYLWITWDYESGCHNEVGTIYDLTGIEDFKSLLELRVVGSLTSIDVSNNKKLTLLHMRGVNLKSVNFGENNVLKELDWNEHNTSELKEIDLSTLRNLEQLGLVISKLESLDVSMLKKLDTLVIQGSELTSLDLESNRKLKFLDLNDFPITQIDLSKNLALEYLGLSSIPITTLDTRYNVALKELVLRHMNLNSIDLSRNVFLEKLNIAFASTTLFKQLDISKNIELKELILYKVPLTSLDITKNIALTDLSVYGGMTVSYIDLSKNTLMEYINFETSLTSLNLNQNTQLWYVYIKNSLIQTLDLSENKLVTEFQCLYNSSLSMLNIKNGNNTGIDFFKVRFNNLGCIQVDNVDYSTENWNLGLGSTAFFSEDCGY